MSTINQNENIQEKKPKYDINYLGSLLCCPPKYHPIYMAIKNCNNTELKKLYNDLKKYNDNKPLNSFLELEFKIRLNDSKEQKNEL